MSELVILTCSGLSNRLKPILSGLRIARLTGRQLRVVWNTAQAVSAQEGPANLVPDQNGDVSMLMPCGWADLFARDIPPPACIREEDCLPLGEYRIPRDHAGSLVVRYTWRLLRFEDEPDLDWAEKSHLNGSALAIVAETRAGLPALEPSTAIQSRISEFLQQHPIDGSTLGLHVRRNHPYCQQIRPAQFLAAVEHALETSPLESVFVASDDLEIEQLFAQRFGRRAFSYPKRERDRTIQASIEDALVDLHLLSRAARILGTLGSTFGEMAWWLGGCRAENQYIRPEESDRPKDSESAPDIERDPFGGPFNGQVCRQHAFRELLTAVPFRAIVETGTLTGSTTEFFAREFSGRVVSVDLSKRHVKFARRRLASYPQVRLEIDDSRALLERLATDAEFPKSEVFFYLDAHWNADLPLRDEVRLILAHWPDAVIMIDDFRVPDDPGYGYDSYPNDQVLQLEYLAPVLSNATRVFFPATRSSDETGARRGSVVFTASEAMATAIASAPSFRPYSICLRNA